MEKAVQTTVQPKLKVLPQNLQTQTQLEESRKEALRKAAEEYIMFHLPDAVDENQRKFLIALCVHLNLDPFKREIHFIPYQEYRYDEKLKKKVPTGRFKVEAVVSYLVYVRRALMTGKLKGWDVKLEKAEDGILKAVCTIHRADFDHPFVWEVYLNEAKRETTVWKEQPLFMLKKVCIAQAFRLAFPEATGELPYTEEEILARLNSNIVETTAISEEESQITKEETQALPSSQNPQSIPQENSQEKQSQESTNTQSETQSQKTQHKQSPSQSQTQSQSKPSENLKKLF